MISRQICITVLKYAKLIKTYLHRWESVECISLRDKDLINLGQTTCIIRLGHCIGVTSVQKRDFYNFENLSLSTASEVSETLI